MSGNLTQLARLENYGERKGGCEACYPMPREVTPATGGLKATIKERTSLLSIAIVSSALAASHSRPRSAYLDSAQIEITIRHAELHE